MNKIALDASQEWELRVDLAAAFRLAVEFGWHESVGNHFSAAVSADGTRFLMNPRWRHFGAVRASELQLLDANDPETMGRADAPDPSAWAIHGAVHRLNPGARVLLHCHPTYAAALCCLSDPRLLPVDQNSARFFGRTALDLAFGGIADEDDEGARIAGLLGGNDVLIMGNHGISVQGATVADAFESLYFFERAAKTLMLAYGTGQPLNVMPDALAARTARDWLDYAGSAQAHFAALKAMLDARGSDYAT